MLPMPTVPEWLLVVAWAWIALCLLSAGIAWADVLAGNRQHMWIMNLVWPLVLLWSGPIGLLAYFTVGRTSTQRAVMRARERTGERPGAHRPMWQAAGLAALHCGSGCTLGDIVAELAVLAVPVFLFGSRVFGTWAVDFVAAFALGIVFQYFTIVPMKQLPMGKGVVAALRADALSLTAWQVGMYGWMAIALFALFSERQLPKWSPAFWFMMQIAMFAGFLTSYPVNWWLVRRGIKERM